MAPYMMELAEEEQAVLMMPFSPYRFCKNMFTEAQSYDEV